MSNTSNYLVIIVATLFLQSCAQSAYQTKLVFTEQVNGKWIQDLNADYMLNPQTSGLTYYNGDLYSISDGSADESQIQRLHKIQPNKANVTKKLGPLSLATSVQGTCFKSYLMSRPDYEGLVVIPGKQNQWLTVTEDATRAGELSAQCKDKFKETGSTEHPTLLVKVELIDDKLLVTGVRAVQFDLNDKVGNFPNDGIEGLTITRDSRILLGLEKDTNTQARVFEMPYSDDMFDTLDEFVRVSDTELLFPEFEQGNHPINGMDIYYPNNSSKGFLIAAARNDDQLWILDLAKDTPTKIVNVEFFAPSSKDTSCESYHKIKNTAIEGVAVYQETLYLINDPWKRVYEDNTVCEQDRIKYQEFAPLLFQMPINPDWFK